MLGTHRLSRLSEGRRASTKSKDETIAATGKIQQAIKKPSTIGNPAGRGIIAHLTDEEKKHQLMRSKRRSPIHRKKYPRGTIQTNNCPNANEKPDKQMTRVKGLNFRETGIRAHVLHNVRGIRSETQHSGEKSILVYSHQSPSGRQRVAASGGVKENIAHTFETQNRFPNNWLESLKAKKIRRIVTGTNKQGKKTHRLPPHEKRAG